jgi:hypothetical protein
VIPDELKLRCSTCGQAINSLFDHICQQPAEPLAELDALRQRVAELEGGLNAVLEAVKLPGKKGEFQQENGLVFVTRLVKQRNAVIEIAHKALGIPME